MGLIPRPGTKTMIRLYAGPWIGEFGWALFGWQGVLRYLAKDYDRVIILGADGLQPLYEDFAYAYLPMEHSGTAPSEWGNNKEIEMRAPLRNKGDAWIGPQQLTLMPNAPKQKFIQYGKEDLASAYDLVYHSRALNKYGSDYVNYSDKQWQGLLKNFEGSKIACIGTVDGASHHGGDDLRGVPLRETMDILRNSRVVIGPSSGPMHLAALCGIPTVVWSGFKRSAERYKKEWNPFNTPVVVVEDKNFAWDKKGPWGPTHQEILSAVEEVRA